MQIGVKIIFKQPKGKNFQLNIALKEVKVGKLQTDFMLKGAKS